MRLRRCCPRFRVGLLLVALAVLGAAASASAETVSFTGQECRTWEVPVGVGGVGIRAVGQAGQSGEGSPEYGVAVAKGGAGDAVSATLSVSSKEILDVCVDEGGGAGATAGFSNEYSGTGGGASGVGVGSGFSAPVLVAGGGGGGGAEFCCTVRGGNGGAAGRGGEATIDHEEAEPGLNGEGGSIEGGALFTSSGPGKGQNGKFESHVAPGGGGGGGYVGGGGGIGGSLSGVLGGPPPTGSPRGGGGGAGGTDYCDGALVTCTTEKAVGKGAGSVTLTYTVIPAPTAKIESPAGDKTYTVGKVVKTKFSCADGAGAPGIESCTDSNGGSGTSGRLYTALAGISTYTVTAKSKDGEVATAQIIYAVGPKGSKVYQFCGSVVGCANYAFIVDASNKTWEIPTFGEYGVIETVKVAKEPTKAEFRATSEEDLGCIYVAVKTKTGYNTEAKPGNWECSGVTEETWFAFKL
jgi:hypothetical protein